ncbi:hypothetical protein SAMN04244579_03953 [Azotobacter beijerinckii]|uniref:Uncharacterized protein n=1 Tax=Azotobacter beijerinckii TaxID=170623 RepID=A0A1H6XVQ2_9GAMM|nr:hypothetical protein [Azotobacter beijerinckii]SEJ33119.1 hypothetical protein SAMN04244579_03953 [Azotobacter beijerinckii]
MTHFQRCQPAAKAEVCLMNTANVEKLRPEQALPQSVGAERYSLGDELWSAAIDLEGAGDVMDQLHGLFVAIRKLGSEDTVQLALIGQYLTEEWSDLLSGKAQRSYAKAEEAKQ